MTAGVGLCQKDSGCCLQTINSEGINCGWKRVDGYLFPASGDQKDFQSLDQEMSAYIRAGLTDVQKVPPCS